MQNPSSFIKEFVYVFLAFFLIYFGSFLLVNKTGMNPQTLQSEDFISTAVLPFSIIKEHNLDLNEYYDLLTANYPHPDDPTLVPYYLKPVGQKVYSFFPSFTAFIVTPLYIVPAYMGYDQSIEGIRILSRLSGAFVTSLSAAVFWFILKRSVEDKKKRIILLLIYALATNSLSISSQGLWQHGTSQLFNGLGLLSTLLGFYGLSGFAFGLSTIARPTNLLSLVVFAVLIFYKTRKPKTVIKFLTFSAIPLIWEVAVDTYTYGSIFNTGYGNHNRWTANIIEGFTGMWLSPSKGLLITTPVLIFALYGIYKVLQNPSKRKVNTALAAIIFLHTLIMGKWYNWFGGYSWGTRMAADILPYLVFMLIPFVESKYYKKKVLRFVFYIIGIFSFIYHFAGLIFFDGVWHAIFDGKSKFWLWDIYNSQAIFSIRRLLAKLSLIENPIPPSLRAQQ